MIVAQITMLCGDDIYMSNLFYLWCGSTTRPGRSCGKTQYVSFVATPTNIHHGGGVPTRLSWNRTHYWRKLGWKGHESHICSTTHAPRPLRVRDTRSKATIDGQDRREKKNRNTRGWRTRQPVVGKVIAQFLWWITVRHKIGENQFYIQRKTTMRVITPVLLVLGLALYARCEATGESSREEDGILECMFEDSVGSCFKTRLARNLDQIELDVTGKKSEPPISVVIERAGSVIADVVDDLQEADAEEIIEEDEAQNDNAGEIAELHYDSFYWAILPILRHVLTITQQNWKVTCIFAEI